jgi:hypothetical protein
VEGSSAGLELVDPGPVDLELVGPELVDPGLVALELAEDLVLVDLVWEEDPV